MFFFGKQMKEIFLYIINQYFLYVLLSNWYNKILAI